MFEQMEPNMYKWTDASGVYVIKIKSYTMEREFYIGYLLGLYSCKNPQTVRFPKYFEHFKCNGKYILVMEYIKGYHDAYEDGMCEKIIKFLLEFPLKFTHYDVHYQNIRITSEGFYYIIDLGQAYLDIPHAEEYLKLTVGDLD